MVLLLLLLLLVFHPHAWIPTTAASPHHLQCALATDPRIDSMKLINITNLLRPRCERVALGLRAGVVWQNCSQPAFIQAPWGGYKKSGFGRELGRWGLEEFLGTKQITSCAGTYSYEWYGK